MSHSLTTPLMAALAVTVWLGGAATPAGAGEKFVTVYQAPVFHTPTAVPVFHAPVFQAPAAAPVVYGVSAAPVVYQPAMAYPVAPIYAFPVTTAASAPLVTAMPVISMAPPVAAGQARDAHHEAPANPVAAELASIVMMLRDRSNEESVTADVISQAPLTEPAPTPAAMAPQPAYQEALQRMDRIQAMLDNMERHLRAEPPPPRTAARDVKTDTEDRPVTVPRQHQGDHQKIAELEAKLQTTVRRLRSAEEQLVHLGKRLERMEPKPTTPEINPQNTPAEASVLPDIDP